MEVASSSALVSAAEACIDEFLDPSKDMLARCFCKLLERLGYPVPKGSRSSLKDCIRDTAATGETALEIIVRVWDVVALFRSAVRGGNARLSERLRRRQYWRPRFWVVKGVKSNIEGLLKGGFDKAVEIGLCVGFYAILGQFCSNLSMDSTELLRNAFDVYASYCVFRQLWKCSKVGKGVYGYLIEEGSLCEAGENFRISVGGFVAAWEVIEWKVKDGEKCDCCAKVVRRDCRCLEHRCSRHCVYESVVSDDESDSDEDGSL